jgi:hypothetical protein
MRIANQPSTTTHHHVTEMQMTAPVQRKIRQHIDRYALQSGGPDRIEIEYVGNVGHIRFDGKIVPPPLDLTALAPEGEPRLLPTGQFLRVHPLQAFWVRKLDVSVDGRMLEKDAVFNRLRWVGIGVNYGCAHLLLLTHLDHPGPLRTKADLLVATAIFAFGLGARRGSRQAAAFGAAFVCMALVGFAALEHITTGSFLPSEFRALALPFAMFVSGRASAKALEQRRAKDARDTTASPSIDEEGAKARGAPSPASGSEVVPLG